MARCKHEWIKMGKRRVNIVIRKFEWCMECGCLRAFRKKVGSDKPYKYHMTHRPSNSYRRK